MNLKRMVPPIEVLAPAGDRERLEAALDFGAHAVYLAGKEFGMRSAPDNFDPQALQVAVKLSHAKGVKVYLTCNTLPRNEELPRLPAFLAESAQAGVDAFILSDLGTLNIAKRVAPQVDVHISTQAGVVNYETARAFWEMGAKRVVLARELSLEEIAEIRQKTSPNLELEAFVHGAMCVSFSGRCLISNYLTGRDANRGECAQPCRWKYRLVEEKREGQYFPIVEEETGTYFFNSRDLCMIEYLPQLIKAGVTSLKIEGRAKSAYYVAVVTNAYRHALDDYLDQGSRWTLRPWIRDEVEKISHREYHTGFYLGDQPGQVYQNGGYLRDYEVVAVCDGYANGEARLSQRNRFFRGAELDVLEPGGIPFIIHANQMYDEEHQPIESAPHATQTVYLPTDRPIAKGALLRCRRTPKNGE